MSKKFKAIVINSNDGIDSINILENDFGKPPVVTASTNLFQFEWANAPHIFPKDRTIIKCTHIPVVQDGSLFNAFIFSGVQNADENGITVSKYQLEALGGELTSDFNTAYNIIVAVEVEVFDAIKYTVEANV